jgi:AraC-like DNA-binding protein
LPQRAAHLTERANLAVASDVAEISVNVNAVRAAVFAAAVRTSRPPEELAAAVGVPMSALADPDARVSHVRVVRAWATLVRETGDAALGLYAAQLIDAAATDRLEPLLSQSPTLGDAFQTFLRYQQLYHSGAASRADVRGDIWILSFGLHRDAEPCAALTDFVLGNWIRRIRRAVATKLVPRETRFRQPAPNDRAPYVELFGSKLAFGSTGDAIHFDAASARLPIAGANPALRSILENQASAVVRELAPDGAFLRDARNALEALLDGAIDIDKLARALATSPRTLQRRLAESDTTFQGLLSNVRHELAVKHLASGRSVTDTAFLLGFSELSAFSRAFRRWTGHAPRMAKI